MTTDKLSPANAWPDQIDALDLAIIFHHTYERLAPNMGYDTRKETRIFDPESANGKLMVAVCAEILPKLHPAATNYIVRRTDTPPNPPTVLTTTQAPTPRTDAKHGCWFANEKMVPSDFARQLERELAEAREEVAACQEELRLCQQDAITLQNELAATQAELEVQSVGLNSWINIWRERTERAEAELREERIARKEDARDYQSQLEHSTNELAAAQAELGGLRKPGMVSLAQYQDNLAAAQAELKKVADVRDAWHLAHEERVTKHLDAIDRAEKAEAELKAQSEIVKLQSAKDGVWIHLNCDGQGFSYCLDNDWMAKKFCNAYRAYLQYSEEKE
jgi:hypothetical protein